MNAPKVVFQVGDFVDVIGGNYKGKKGKVVHLNKSSVRVHLLDENLDRQPKRALQMKSLRRINKTDAEEELHREKSKCDSTQAAMRHDVDALLAAVYSFSTGTGPGPVQVLLVGEGDLSFSDALWTILKQRYLDRYLSKLPHGALQLVCTVYVCEKKLESTRNAMLRAARLKNEGHVVLYSVDCKTMAKNTELLKVLHGVRWTIFNFPHTGETHVCNDDYGKNLKALVDAYVKQAKLLLRQDISSRIIVSHNWSYYTLFGYADFQVRNGVQRIWEIDFDADRKFENAGYHHVKTNDAAVTAPNAQPKMFAYGLRPCDLSALHRQVPRQRDLQTSMAKNSISEMKTKGLPSDTSDVVSVVDKNKSVNQNILKH